MTGISVLEVNPVSFLLKVYDTDEQMDLRWMGGKVFTNARTSTASCVYSCNVVGMIAFVNKGSLFTKGIEWAAKTAYRH